MQQNHNPTKKLLRLSVVKELTGYSASTIYLNMSKGTFPKQIKLGEKSVAWLESDIATWIEQKINGTTTYPQKPNEHCSN